MGSTFFIPFGGRSHNGMIKPNESVFCVCCFSATKFFHVLKLLRIIASTHIGTPHGDEHTLAAHAKQ